MKNKDILAMEKAKIVEKMNQAIKDDDAKMFSEAFTELCQKIEENVLEQAREMMKFEAGCDHPGPERRASADLQGKRIL